MSIKFQFNKEAGNDRQRIGALRNPVLFSARLLVFICQTASVALRPKSQALLLLLLFLGRSVSAVEQVCGEFKSGSGSKSGRFSSAVIEENRAYNRQNNVTDPLLCIYKFIANKNEKVYLKFDKFDIKSLAPDCVTEYLDIYIEVTESTLESFVETNFLSRWCGWKKPYELVSYYNIIVFAYYADMFDRDSSFSGEFEFVSAEPYNLGRKSQTPCAYEFRSELIESGVIQSPTYPGTYPNVLNCTYTFIGRPNERISFFFEDISIHYGADHCPYDVLKMYDYQRAVPEARRPQQPKGRSPATTTTTTAASNKHRVLINSYCGSLANFTLFSTSNLFDIEFEMSDSLGHEEYADDASKIKTRKGFRAYFKFSKNFADLSFITGTHVTGTNCDQLIISGAQTPAVAAASAADQPELSGLESGVIYSPNFFRGNAINASCKYIFEGVNDMFNFELVKLQFTQLDLKYLPLDEDEDGEMDDAARRKSSCGFNELKSSHFVVSGSEKTPSYCFKDLRKDEPELKSSSSKMTLIFNSIANEFITQPPKFKAIYTFYTEYGIPGNRVFPNRTCLYTYSSHEGASHGHIVSPRYPQNYLLDMKCTYVFEIGATSKKERLLLTFRDFRLTAYTDNKCLETDDNLSIYEAVTNDHLNKFAVGKVKRNRESSLLMSRYCGISVPAPYISSAGSKQIRLVFNSDKDNYAQGFNINYNYIQIDECKSSVGASENVTDGQINITNKLSPFFTCEWTLTNTQKGKSFILTFRNLNIGDYRPNQFVVRIYDLNDISDKINSAASASGLDESKMFLAPKFEYTLDRMVKFFAIDSTRIRLQLILGKSFDMGEGRLQINWITAAKNRTCLADEFLCVQSNYCIKAKHYCDRIEHCAGDVSDEPEKCFIKSSPSPFPYLQIVSITGSVAVLIIILSTCIICRIKAAKKAHFKKGVKINGIGGGGGHSVRHLHQTSSLGRKPQNGGSAPGYYRYSPANSMDYLEAAITSV